LGTARLPSTLLHGGKTAGRGFSWKFLYDTQGRMTLKTWQNDLETNLPAINNDGYTACWWQYFPTSTQNKKSSKSLDFVI